MLNNLQTATTTVAFARLPLNIDQASWHLRDSISSCLQEGPMLWFISLGKNNLFILWVLFSFDELKIFLFKLSGIK